MLSLLCHFKMDKGSNHTIMSDNYNELNTGIALVDGGVSDIPTLGIKKSANYIISPSGMKMYETVFSGYISLSSYAKAGEERYLGYMSNPYPQNTNSIPIIIPVILMNQEQSITQVAALYVKGNGGIYLSTPQTLKSALFSNVCITLCKQYCYYH